MSNSAPRCSRLLLLAATLGCGVELTTLITGMTPELRTDPETLAPSLDGFINRLEEEAPPGVWVEDLQRGAVGPAGLR